MYQKPSRDHFIPAGAVKVTPKGLDVVFYLYPQYNGKPAAMCFIGKAQKPSWRFYFPSIEARAKRIAAQMESCKAVADQKAKRAADKKAEAAKGHGWEVGLILVSSWGYEQTNVDWYEVVEVIGTSMVKVEAIGGQSATDASKGGSSMSDYVVPNPESRLGEFIRAKVIGGRIKVSSCSSASVWDGLKRYNSWYA